MVELGQGHKQCGCESEAREVRRWGPPSYMGWASVQLRFEGLPPVTVTEWHAAKCGRPWWRAIGLAGLPLLSMETAQP